tara:strand:- start:363 stop:473 length:111 start_codon:yes stop_codon:yes gene_type:complete
MLCLGYRGRHYAFFVRFFLLFPIAAGKVFSEGGLWL